MKTLVLITSLLIISFNQLMGHTVHFVESVFGLNTYYQKEIVNPSDVINLSPPIPLRGFTAHYPTILPYVRNNPTYSISESSGYYKHSTDNQQDGRVWNNNQLLGILPKNEITIKKKNN